MSYKEGKSVILSDSISTLNIIKDHVSKEVNFRNIKVDFEWDVKKKSIVRVLQLLDAKVKHYDEIDNQYQLIPALKELKIQVTLLINYSAINLNYSKRKETLISCPKSIN